MRTISGFTLSTLFISLALISNINSSSLQQPTSTTTLRFFPQPQPFSVYLNEKFTIACVVENVSNLWGLDIKIAWDPSVLTYINHTATFPKENYPSPIPPSPYAGILRGGFPPIVVLKDDVNVTSGTYWAAAISLQPGPSFSGNGTVFVMNFKVPGHLATTHINFTYTNIVDSATSQLGHVSVDYEVIITSDTIARLDPESIIFGPRPCIGETFVLAVRIDNVTDLWTVGIEITWNTTLIDYVGHITKIPRNTYPDGILYEPLIQIVDGLVQAGELELLYGIPEYGTPFDGSGIVCEVTFEIAYQALPNEPNVNFTMEWVSAIRNQTDWIPHLQKNCSILIYSLPSPDVNSDGTVDIFDIVSVASLYGHTEIDIDWNPWADLAPEYGIIDIFDIVTCASHYGETYLGK